mmetsp:Transcript_32653/g.45326  ORF Transcript_32653/g.45326 Transcript_32653/m.45326 type:complete len:392 (-) Transcript_32653:65-1240(-)
MYSQIKCRSLFSSIMHFASSSSSSAGKYRSHESINSSYLGQYKSKSVHICSKLQYVSLKSKLFSSSPTTSSFAFRNTISAAASSFSEAAEDVLKSDSKIVPSEDLDITRRRTRLRRNQSTEGSGDETDIAWGASTKRGSKDKRRGLSKRMVGSKKVAVEKKPESDDGEDEADKQGQSIDFGEQGGAAPRWYLLQVMPNREKSAARIIENLNKKIHLPRVEPLVPQASEVGVNARTGRPTAVMRLLMPGYVMVRTRMDNQIHESLQGCNNVKHFMGYPKIFGPRMDNKVQLPLPMPKQQLDLIMEEMSREEKAQEEKKAKKATTPDFPFEIADVVTVTSGPYKGFSGQVMEVDPEGDTVQLLLVIFGKNTEVCLPKEEVVKAKAKLVKRLGV